MQAGATATALGLNPILVMLMMAAAAGPAAAMLTQVPLEVSPYSICA